MNPQNEKNLEKLVHHALRDLPARHAPRTLESRVQAEIARRAALPWWHKSFTHWPVAVRAVFVVLCGGIAKVAVMAVVWVSAGLNTAQFKAAFATELQWLHTGANLLNATSDFLRTVVGSIPPVWLYGSAAGIAALYIALFGIGAAAYRTLYSSS